MRLCQGPVQLLQNLRQGPGQLLQNLHQGPVQLLQTQRQGPDQLLWKGVYLPHPLLRALASLSVIFNMIFKVFNFHCSCLSVHYMSVFLGVYRPLQYIWMYRVVIKYCVFPSNFLNFLDSASSAAALEFYLPCVCTHTDAEGK